MDVVHVLADAIWKYCVEFGLRITLQSRHHLEKVEQAGLNCTGASEEIRNGLLVVLAGTVGHRFNPGNFFTGSDWFRWEMRG